MTCKEKMAAALIVVLKFLVITVVACQNNSKRRVWLSGIFLISHMFGITGFFGNFLSFYCVKNIDTH